MNASALTGSGAPAGAPVSVAAFADAGLVTLARDGDREAREELARRCRGPAYLLALQLLGDPDDALDAAQDPLLRLFESSKTAPPAARSSTTSPGCARRAGRPRSGRPGTTSGTSVPGAP